MKVEPKDIIGDRYPITVYNEMIRKTLRKKETQESDIKIGCSPIDLAYYHTQNQLYQKKHKKTLISKKTFTALMLSMMTKHDGDEDAKEYARYIRVGQVFEKFTNIISDAKRSATALQLYLNLWCYTWKQIDEDVEFLNSLEEGEVKERYLSHLGRLPQAIITQNQKTGKYEILIGSEVYCRPFEVAAVYFNVLSKIKDVIFGFETIIDLYPELVGLLNEELCRNMESIIFPVIEDEEIFSYRAYRKQHGNISYRTAITEERTKEPKESRYLLFPAWEDIPYSKNFAEKMKKRIEEILNYK